MAEDVSRTIAALEDERYAAMLSGDAGTLDRLLDDRLRHVHSTRLEPPHFCNALRPDLCSNNAMGHQRTIRMVTCTPTRDR
jgi:hypothetical protein